jgi:3-isopropylmalate/(R)-2-methylmalate dehydratase large subunit
VAPDDKTIDYVVGREYAPTGADLDAARELWGNLRSDPGAVFDREIQVRAEDIAPYVTYGTTPAMGVPIGGTVPDPASLSDPEEQQALARALDYMGLSPGSAIAGQRVDQVFIGSCTNSRIEDIRLAAEVLRGRRVAPHTALKVVPGSQGVKRQAEAEGLDVVIREAGGVWDEPSCSLCIGVNGDLGESGQYIASTSNRNFRHRQGTDVRTLLMSPLTAAATAVEGVVADPRPFLEKVEVPA